jgi:hypothetical protein
LPIPLILKNTPISTQSDEISKNKNFSINYSNSFIQKKVEIKIIENDAKLFPLEKKLTRKLFFTNEFFVAFEMNLTCRKYNM